MLALLLACIIWITKFSFPNFQLDPFAFWTASIS